MFFDTYALFELAKGNPSYRKYYGVSPVTTRLNLMELHHALLKEHTRDYADTMYDRLSQFCTEPDDDVLKEASILRSAWKRRDVSFIDCIGYILALRLGIPFLTGDRQFEDLKNVEFVK